MTLFQTKQVNCFWRAANSRWYFVFFWGFQGLWRFQVWSVCFLVSSQLKGCWLVMEECFLLEVSTMDVALLCTHFFLLSTCKWPVQNILLCCSLCPHDRIKMNLRRTLGEYLTAVFWQTHWNWNGKEPIRTSLRWRTSEDTARYRTVACCSGNYSNSNLGLRTDWQLNAITLLVEIVKYMQFHATWFYSKKNQNGIGI